MTDAQYRKPLFNIVNFVEVAHLDLFLQRFDEGLGAHASELFDLEGVGHGHQGACGALDVLLHSLYDKVSVFSLLRGDVFIVDPADCFV